MLKINNSCSRKCCFKKMLTHADTSLLAKLPQWSQNESWIELYYR